MGGFIVASSPSPPASEDESGDGSRSDDVDEDDGASSPSDDEMSTWYTYPLSPVTKRGSSFDMRVVIHRGRVSVGDFCDMGSVYEGCSKEFCIFSFLSILDPLSFVHRSCDYLLIANLILMLIYIFRLLLLSFTYLYMCCLFSPFMHMIFIYCMQSIIYISH